MTNVNTNVSFFTSELKVLKDNSKEAKKVNSAEKSMTDNIVDVTSEVSREGLAKDIDGAISSHKDVYFKTSQGIAKIPATKVPLLLAELRDKLLNADLNVGGFNLFRKDKILSVDITQKSENIISARKLGETYHGDKQIKSNDHQQIHIKDFDSTEGRINILNSITQNSSDFNTHGKVRCGPSCIVAAAIRADGLDGLKTLINTIKTQPEYRSLPNDIKTALDKSLSEINKTTLLGLLDRTFDKKNISVIQEALYQVLDKRENNWADNKGNKLQDDERTGLKDEKLKNQSLSSFIKLNPQIKELLKNVEIKLIDNTGGGQGNHWVMFMKDHNGNKAVYDPFDKKDGNQVIKDSKDISKYELALHVDENSKPKQQLYEKSEIQSIVNNYLDG